MQEKQVLLPMQLVVSKIEFLNPNVATYTLVRADGAPLPPIRAGQYLTVFARAGGSFSARPYSISSSPKDARAGFYTFTLEQYPGGYFPNAVIAGVKVGDTLWVRGPVGDFCYEPEIDPPQAVFLSGGSAVTPFISMLRAIEEGDEDFSATLLFGSTTESEILFRPLLDRLAKHPKIRIVHVLSDEQVEGYEHGYLTAELIQKYAPAGDYSLFICGPGAMYSFLETEIPKLGLPEKWVHHGMVAVPRNLAERADYPGGSSPETRQFTLTVEGVEAAEAEWAQAEAAAGLPAREARGSAPVVLPMRADETVLTALERGGVRARQLCNSGECGYCTAELLAGEVYVPQFGLSDKRTTRLGGKLHPCCSFPLSDLRIRL